MSTLILRSAVVNFSRLSIAADNGYGSEVSAFFSGISKEDNEKLFKFGITPTAALTGADEIIGYNFRRYTSTQRGVTKQPLIVINNKKKPMLELIGNGSVVDIKLEVYPSAYSESGWGYQLNAIMVKELVKVNEIVNQSNPLIINEDF